MGYRLLFGRVFLLIAGMIALAGLIHGLSTLLFLHRAATTSGTISGYERREGMAAPFVEGDGAGILYYSVVEYRGSDGGTRTFTSPVGRNRRIPDVGTEVQVLYLPQRTGGERINAAADIWAGTAILGGVGLLFALIGLIAPRGFIGARSSIRDVTLEVNRDTTSADQAHRGDQR